jgi:hypothetical protein
VRRAAGATLHDDPAGEDRAVGAMPSAPIHTPADLAVRRAASAAVRRQAPQNVLRLSSDDFGRALLCVGKFRRPGVIPVRRIAEEAIANDSGAPIRWPEG